MKRLAVVLALVGLNACGDDGGSSGPSPTAVLAAQTGDAASGAVTQSTSAATSAVIEAGTNGESSARAPGRSTSRTHARKRPRPPGFSFGGSVSVTVDFDATTSGGADKHPNATGQIAVSATGAISGTSTAGSASYSMLVTFLTPCTFTDPMSGASATVAAGGSFSYGLDVSWTWTDSANWGVASSSSGSVTALTATVTSSSGTSGATVNGGHSATLSVSKTAGVLSASGTWSGSHEIAIAGGPTVIISSSGPGSIYVTVGPFTYGPYTLVELLAIFGFIP